MGLIPAQNGNGGGSSGKKIARGYFDATGSQQTILFSNHNIEGDTDFKPRFLYVYKMYPGDAVGSAGNLTNGTHINILDTANYPDFAYRGTMLSGTYNLYRSEFPIASGGSRIHNTFVGGFDFTGLAVPDARYQYVAVE